MALVRRPAKRGEQESNLARYRDFPSIFDEVDQVFGSLMPRFASLGGLVSDYPVDLYETSNELVLEMAVPGIKGEDLDISLEGRQLSVNGTLEVPEGEDRRYWLQGIPRGQFSRTVTLPSTVEADGVKAVVHDGMLTLTLPKVEEARARKIAIEAS